MTSTVSKFRKTPPYVRLFNSFGRRREPKAISARDLMERASRRTRLEDFGDWELQAPLTRLVESLKQDARLTPTGWLATRTHIIDLLVNRLQIVAERKNKPEAHSSIVAPIFVVGLPRTGTTLLHGLLAQDPELRAPLTWEVMEPSPAPVSETFETDTRIGRTNRRLRWVDRLAPDFKRIHPVGAQLPQECIAITTHAFMSIQFHTTCRVPGYQAWLDDTDLRPAYRCHRDFLLHLQREIPTSRWVLKAPGHLFGIDALFETYPDATIVQTHRDPLRVVSSIASHTTVLRSAFSDHVDPTEIGADWTERWAQGLERTMFARERRNGQGFVDVVYDQLVADPIAAVRALYGRLGMTLSEPAKSAMRDYLARWPKNKFGPHRYDMADFGLDKVAERDRFAGYCARFGIQTNSP